MERTDHLAQPNNQGLAQALYLLFHPINGYFSLETYQVQVLYTLLSIKMMDNAPLKLDILW